MTVEQYKEKVPEHKDLEGDALWNAMENYMLLHGETHNYTDSEGRERIRFPWTPEDGDGTPIGIWDVVKNEAVDSKQEWKPPTKQSAIFIVFDVSGKEPMKIIGEPIPIIETTEGLKIYKDGTEQK
jgi:hypothetical protein